MSRSTPLFKYHLVFFGAYFAAAMGVGVLQAIGRFGLTFQMVAGFLLPPLAAFAAMRLFHRDHARGIEADERSRLVFVQLAGLAVLALFGMLFIRGLYNDTFIGTIRPMSAAYVLVAPVATVLLGFGQLWFVYAFLDGRLAPATGRAAAATAAPRVRTMVVGSGAGAHALAWKLGQSPRVLEVVVAPGNAGTATAMRCRNIAVDPADADALANAARRENVQLVVLTGSDAAVAERLRSLGLSVVGPTTAALAQFADATATAAFSQRHAIAWSGVANASTVAIAALVDDDTAHLLGTMQSRADGDETVVVSPAPSALPARMTHELLTPTVRGLMRDKASYGGFLHARVDIAADGSPRLVDLRAGLDDATAPAWILRLQSDLFELLEAAAERFLDAVSPRTNPRPAAARSLSATADMAGRRIAGLRAAPLGSQVFHQATRLVADHATVAGAHVLSIGSLGDTAADAERRAAELAQGIEWVAPAAVAVA